MLIAQITDMHVGLDIRVGSERIDTAARLERAVAHLNRLDPRPDFVIATGDLTADGRPSEYATLADLLGRLVMPFTLLPGNHDARASLCEAFPDMAWDGAGHEPAALFHEYDLEPLWLFALDTLAPGEHHGELGQDQLDWLDGRLGARNGRPSLVAMHHPPVAVGIPAFDAMNCTDGAALGAVLERHRGVEAVICGHVHRPVSLRWAGTVLHVTPSSSYQYGLAMRENEALRPVDETPAVRLLAWLPETGLVSHLSPIP